MALVSKLTNERSMDLFQASTRSKKPDFGLCKWYQACLESDIPVVRQRHQEETIIPFSFPVVALEGDFQDLLWDIRCYLDRVQVYYVGTWTTPPHIPLALFRNLIQHRILSIDRDVSNISRELCRLAVLLFSSVVVYPLQNLAPMQQYLEELTRILQNPNDIDADFKLWLLFLGAMATADQMTWQLWYISELRYLVPRYGRDWLTVRGVLKSFLWLDTACGEGALEVWQRVMLIE